MKPTSKTSLIACLAISGAFAAGFASGPASAQTYRGPFAFEFKYDAAEFANIESAQNLVSRLQSVVTAYCGKTSTMSPEERHATNICVKRTMRESIDKFSNATVAQAFLQSRVDG